MIEAVLTITFGTLTASVVLFGLVLIIFERYK
jgi:hypothetical protein